MDVKIKNLEYETSDKIVTKVEWEATVSEGYQIEDALDEEGKLLCPGPYITSHIQRTNGVTTFNAQQADAEGFIPYEDLTEKDVMGWLDLPDDLENTLLERIGQEKKQIEQRKKQIVEKTPWEIRKEAE